VKKIILSLAVLQAISLFGGPLLLASPKFVAGPVDIQGTIREVTWVPDEEVKAQRITGSAGFDRTIPAHFLVSVGDYTGLDADTLDCMKSLYKWSIPDQKEQSEMPLVLVLWLPHPDKTFLKKGMRIRVQGYTIRGDEGGDIGSYKNLDILYSGQK